MECSQSVQLSTDCSADPELLHSQNLDPTNESSRNIVESNDLRRVYSETTNVEPSIESSQIDNPPESSNLRIHVGNSPIQQNDSLIDETLQSDRTHIEQESGISIEIQIQVPRETTSKTKKRRKEKHGGHPIQLEPDVPVNLNVPHSSTEFNYHGKMIPMHIDQLCDVHKINHGEFGVVFSIVVKGSTDLPIAVKRILSGNIKTSELSIMQEVCKSEHAYIVDYYCALVNPVNLSLYICMEFMDASIDGFYKVMHEQDTLECGKLDRLLRRIVHDIASGLSFMAIKEIIHRDIKPANLLINKEAFVKLCDFGISRSFTRLSLYFNINNTDYSVLSPLLNTENYMPPGIKGLIQDDMWSFGITLLEVVRGSNPFTNWKSGGRCFALLGWVPYIPAIISDDMQQLILHLLEKETADRPPSYDYILNKSFISDVSDTPSGEECEFVCPIIERIPRIDSSHK